MTLQRASGWVALVSGGLLVVGLAAWSVAGMATGASATVMGPMMGGPMVPGGHMGGAGMHGQVGGYGADSGILGGPTPGAPEVRLELGSFLFQPSDLRLPKDAHVDLTLANPTTVVHDLTVPGLGIHVTVPPGATRIVGLAPLHAGRYPMVCSVPGHADAGMHGTLIIE